MSHQQRTWVQTTDQTTGFQRWDVLINGTPVPGGYVLALPDGSFEAHYPHIVPFTKPTLEQAKERLEWAPPITSGVQRIGEEVCEDASGFVSAKKAAERLGISIYRVNAMVANGKLAARRISEGGYEIAGTSLEKVAECGKGAGAKTC